MAYDEKLAGRVRKYLMARPGISEKKMFGGLCFLLNGNMCCGINGRDLMVRIGPDDYDRTLRRPGVRPMDFTGRPLRGMVYVAPDVLTSSRALRRWLEQAVSFVASLPRKVSTGRRAQQQGMQKEQGTKSLRSLPRR